MDITDKIIYFLFTGILIATGTIVWYSIRQYIKKVEQRFDDNATQLSRIFDKFERLIKELQKINESNIVQDETLSHLHKEVETNTYRLNDHAKRIREIEKIQSGCKANPKNN